MILGVVPIAEKDKDGKVVRKALEVDFVCNLGSTRYYIQSAYSLPDEAKRKYDENGILTVSIYEFLLNSRSIDS